MPSLEIRLVGGAAALLIALAGLAGPISGSDEAAGDSDRSAAGDASARPAPWQRTLSPQDSRRVEVLQQQVAQSRLQGKFDEAHKAAGKVLSVRSAALGDDHWLTGNSRREVALLRQIVDLPAAAQADLVRAARLLGEAERLHAQRRYKDAAERVREVIQLRAARLGRDHLEVALAQFSLATCLRDAGAFDKAERVYAAVLQTRRRHLGTEHPDTATAEMALAGNLAEQGKLAQAEPLFRRAYAVYRQVLGDDHPQTAVGGNNLALNLASQGHYDQAEPLLREMLAVMRRKFGEEHDATATLYNNLAGNLARQGKYAEAESAARAALQIFLRLHGTHHLNTTAAISALASILSGRGEYARAEPLLRRSLEINRQLLPQGHPLLAGEMALLAYHLHYQGKYAQADSLLREAVALSRQRLGPGHPLTIVRTNSLAVNLTAQRRYAEARPLLQRSLEQIRDSLGEDHPSTAMAYNNLGYHLSSQGDYAAAEAPFRAALEIWQRRLGTAHPLTVSGRGNLAVTLDQLGRFAEGEDLWRGILENRRGMFGEHHPLTAMAYRNLGRCLVWQERDEEAERLLISAAEGFEAARSAVSFDGLGRAEYAATGSPLEDLAALLARRNKPGQAWRRLEENLARGLWDDVSMRAGRRLSDEDRAKENSLVAKLRRLDEGISALSAATRPTEQQRQRLQQLSSEREATQASYSRLQRALAKTYGVAGGQLYDLEQIQASLAPDEALVAWLDVTPAASIPGGQPARWACVVRREGPPQWKRLPGTGPSGKWTPEDDELRLKLRAALLEPQDRSNPWQTLTAAARRQRLAPLQDLLDAREGMPAVKHLLVLPSRAMSGIPIEVMAPDRVVSYVPSGTMHAWLQSRPALEMKNSRELLALGDPQLEAATKESAKASRATPGQEIRNAPVAYPPLPASRVEVESIARLFRHHQCLLGPEASERRLQSLADAGELKNFSHLHFATHGELNLQAAMQSALILSRSGSEESIESLLKDQTVFDGRLTAQQVLQTWKLDADLVTLSACQSGLGKPTAGEGYLGFSQAMLLAGARSLVVSLWKVDDVATALLMERFYLNLLGQRRGLSKPMPKAAALDEAKRWLRALRVDEVESLLKRFPAKAGLGDVAVRGQVRTGRPVESTAKSRPFEHPFYWAAFILIGDNN